MELKKLILLWVIMVATWGIHAQVTVEFSAPVTEGCGNLQASFVDQSTSSAGNIVQWSWTLGPNTSNIQNPSAIFNQVGAYEICLTATDSQGNSNTLCKPNYINIYEDPVADFVRSPISGCTPLEVSFTNTSTSPNGSLSQLVWDIGGTTNLAIVNDEDSIITTIYNSVGNYKATLFITDEKGCTDTKIINNAVEALPGPSLDLGIEILSGCELPWEVSFSNNNPDPLTTYYWSFGNGQTFNGQQPNNIFYEEDGTYEISVALNRNGCIDTLRQEVIINASGNSSISITPENACIGTPISFAEASPITPDSIFWDFGDGNTSQLANPQHTYASEGCYEINMIRYTDNCVDTIGYSCVNILAAPEINFEIEGQYNCELPTEVRLIGMANQEGSFDWEITGTGISEMLDGDTITYIINDYGEYQVDLTFTSNSGCINTLSNIPIDIKPFEVNLPVDGPSGCTPLTFTLSDSITSPIAIVDYQWLIGAPINQVLNGANPNFTISDVGRYDVMLIATNAIGCMDTVIMEDYIRVGEEISLDFTVDPLEECILAPKQFTAITSPEVDAWVWGTDGTDTLSTLENPVLSLSNSKLWDISLTVYYNGCPSTLIKEDYVNILDPTVSYIIEYNCEDPYLASFNANVIGADSSYWEIETSPGVLDTFYNIELDTFRFPDRGRYHVKHYAVNYESGCEHFRIDTVEISDPIARFNVDTLQGCSPLVVDVIGSSQDALQLDYVIPGASIDTSLSVLNPTITYTESGVFTGPSLIVTDIHGCKDTLTRIDSVLINTPKAIALHEDFTCIPDSILITNASTDALGEIIDQKWYFDGEYLADTQDSFYVQLDENRYYPLQLKVTDDWGCVDSVSWNQAVFGSDVDASFTVSDSLTCTTHAISFSLVNPNQLDEFASYYWDFGNGEFSTEATPQYRYPNEGSYTICLTLTNSRGCEDTYCLDHNIIVADPVAQFEGDPLYESCPPLLTTFTNQSINANSFEWNFGDNSGLSDNENPAHLYNEPGLYDVTLIARSTIHCADTLSRSDYIFVEGPSGNFSIISDEACVPLTIDIIGEADGDYFFSWDFGNGETSSSTELKQNDTLQYVYSQVGSYLPKLILTDENGCSRSFDADSLRVNDLTLDFDNSLIVSCDLPTQITIENLSTCTDDKVSYQWQVIADDTLSLNNTHLNYNISQKGAYSLALIGMATNCIDTLSVDSMVQIGSVPMASFEINADQLCQETELTFTNNSTSAYGTITDYNWSFGDGNISTDEEPKHTFTQVLNTEVSLHVTTEWGCVDSTTLTIETLENTVPILPDDYTMCLGDSVQILVQLIGEGQSNSSYSWNNTADLSCIDCLIPYASPQDSTEYILTAVHDNGCISMDTMQVHVVPIPGPELVLSQDTLICLEDSAYISVTNYDPALSYTWFDNGLIDCLDCPEVTAYPETNKYFALTVTNEFGCFEKDSIFVEVERQIDDFLISSKGFCDGETVELSASPHVLSPSWRNGNTVICTDCYDTNVSPTSSQYYYVDALSMHGCAYTDSVYVIVVPEESISMINPDTICAGESIQLTSQGYGDPIWTPAAELDADNILSPLATPTTSTMYTVSYTLDDCTLSDSIYIHVMNKVDISATSDTICLQEEAQLFVNGLVDKYEWYQDGQFMNEGPSFSLIPNRDTEVMVVGSYGLCENDTVYVDIMIQPDIDVQLLQSNYTLYINSAEKVKIKYNDTLDYTYEWLPAEGLSCTDCPDPKIKHIAEAMDYSLWVTDNLTGCEEEFAINVRFFNECSEKAFYIPNIFSPNNDGVNDVFSLIAEEPEEFDEIHLFDRWGNLVYRSDDVNFNWDGIYKGSPISSGVYPYRIDYTCLETGEQFAFYGDVTIVR